MKQLISASTLALTVSLAAPLYGQARKPPALSDYDVEAEVQQVLADHAFTGSSILSSVNQGVVKLSGNVRSDAEKALAETKITNLRGVKGVTDLLVVVDHPATAAPWQPTPSATAAAVVAKTITLPVGTVLPIRLSGEIDTKTATAGETFKGTTAANVQSGGITVIPSGTPVTGRIAEAKAAGRLAGAAVLSVELVSLRLPGQTQDLAIVTQQLSSRNNGNGTGTATKTAGGAGFGAVLGALAGGGAGAGIGAASGGAVGLGVSALTPGKNIDLKPEALLQFKLGNPLEVSVATQPASPSAPAGGLAVRTPTAANSNIIDLPNQPDPASFDVVGLKLGMTYQQAMDAVRAKVPQASESTPMHNATLYTPGAQYTSATSVNGPRFTILLNFAETYPFDPSHPEQLTGIFYTPNTPTEADRQQFRQSVLSKYGQPYREVKAINAVWCNKGVSLGSGPLACAPDTPTLQLKGTELILSDNGPADHARAAWNQRTTSGAPPL